ncbi:MAG TPA: hypothetical protein VK903_06745 [Propionicimonas sp.]|nr:hypothetical protein [Propionicimonas sp.]
MQAADHALREFYGPALRQQLAPSPIFRPRLIVVRYRWWEDEERTVTFTVRSSR